MKPMCEKVIPSTNSSWRYVKYDIPQIDFNWHYHPEYEVCLTLNSQGLRYVGDNIADYADADLVLVGPNMPHTWHSSPNEDGSMQVVHVAQIPKVWIENLSADHPEMTALETMLKRSGRGLLFSSHSGERAKALFERMTQEDTFQRYILLLELFNIMLQDEDPQPLSSSFFSYGDKTDAGIDKLDRVIEYIYKNFDSALYADDMAKLAHMSTNHFHRFFKRRTERTLTEFINQLRIGKACKLLITSNHPIAVISDKCGFNNISNFNRQFLSIKSCTPSQFRKQIRAKHLLS
ncbi:helix-turn-helix domain-containing protein [Shewanella sp. Scap07]|uniref:AraC family transcriptional regulator n=1 Tax=Shewanella sp. Scap07 TaxID=2589987 RepID=UPI0015BFF0D0|nr:AraC family transcriptional regulator [Shewanella sp. Scap07]QLE84105.1 helix-turn-helix domain-containing protein [Shewanella sp. Scap07]